MATIVGHLGHSVSADIVGFLWVVSYVGIHRVMYQTIGNRASLLASEPLAWQPPRRIDCRAVAEQGHHGGGCIATVVSKKAE
jgi:hypothetical protein